jgi:diguanylate cyclase (GGDEF)-like protein
VTSNARTDLRSISGKSVTLGDLGFEALVLPAFTQAIDIDDLFRADRNLRGAVIAGSAGQALLTREKLELEMSGRLGFGRALNARTEAHELLPAEVFALSPELDLPTAVTEILARPEELRYHDVLVLVPGAPRIVPVSEIFAGLSDVFQHASLHDPLTGLPNRRMLEALTPTNGHTDSAKIGMLFIDLDDFKGVNDTYGHRAGDAVLTEFAARLSACVRPEDTVVRLGGDEFAVLLLGVDETDAGTIADRVLECMDERFVVEGHSLDVKATLGLAMASDVSGDSDDQTLTGLDTLLRHADGAMLQAKNDGKRRVGRICTGRGPGPFAREALIRRRLPRALDENRFSLHYQPILDMASDTLHSVEALLRWIDPEIGAVGPAEFIPLAEHTGEIHRIGRWVIDQACAQGRAWLDVGTPRKIAVNVSPRQLATGTLPDDIHRSLQRHGLPASLLEIELTEGSALIDVPGAADQLRGLIDAGLSVALDDYGMANSSLALLRQLPLTAVKIDKLFIRDIDTDPFAESIVGALITALNSLGLLSTAEGVERQAQLEILRGQGCRAVQGYLISHPVPATSIPGTVAVWELESADASCSEPGADDVQGAGLL